MENELQQKYLEFQMLEQELRQMEKQIVLVQQQIIELRTLTQNIEDIKDVKSGTEIFSQIGAGIYIKTKVEDAKQLLINTGADVSVIKTAEEVKEIVKNQVMQLESILNRMQNEFQNAIMHAQSLQEELQKESKE